MALGKETTEERVKKIYLAISHGKITKYDKATGQTEEFSYLEGTLDNIYQKERNFNGSLAKFWYIDLRDGEELYSISFPYISGVLKSIILALASDDSLTAKSPIRIEPYEAKGFTKVVVFSDGVKLDWITKDLPPMKQVKVGYNTVTDDSERMEFIAQLAREINSRIGKASTF